jgi:hypothetical protein
MYLFGVLAITPIANITVTQAYLAPFSNVKGFFVTPNHGGVGSSIETTDPGRSLAPPALSLHYPHLLVTFPSLCAMTLRPLPPPSFVPLPTFHDGEDYG